MPLRFALVAPSPLAGGAALASAFAAGAVPAGAFATATLGAFRAGVRHGAGAAAIGPISHVFLISLFTVVFPLPSWCISNVMPPRYGGDVAELCQRRRIWGNA